MEIKIEKYTKDRINDVIDFELQLRKEEDFGVGKLMKNILKMLRIVFLILHLKIHYLS